VLLALEDLHWGDLPSMKLVDAALGRVRHLPLLVVGLGRPEVHDLFPRLWADRGVQEIRLGELTRRAAERLARHALGDSVPAETVARIVDRAGGNAFHLEELIRAVAEGRGDALPETVLAMVAARLDALGPEDRHVLRAASVFGQVFPQEGVLALLGGAPRAAEIEARLSALVEHEALERRAESRSPGDEDLAFRHALLRDGAYAMLTDEDRALGHRLAGAWLEAHGERDSMVLAGHFERGGEPAKAEVHYLHAARHALTGNDFRVRARSSRSATGSPSRRCAKTSCGWPRRGALITPPPSRASWWSRSSAGSRKTCWR
jgi:predicted ATPase